MKKTLITLALTMVTGSAFAQMDHSTMNHDDMDHGQMTQNSTAMDHSNMDHSGMSGMVATSAVGMPANGAKPDKVVHVLLSDDYKITFKKEVKIEPNDVVQFVIMNTGKMNHEFMIGSEKEQLEHREMMKNMTGGHMHDSDNSVTVEPGKAKQMLWHFHGDNNVEFACNMPGHAEAGMVKKLKL